MRRFLAGLILPLAVLLSLLSLGLAPAQADTYTPDWLTRINDLRTSKGIKPLTIDAELSAFAQHWTEHMANAGTLSHNPNLANSPGNWTKAGENVGVGPD